MRCILFALAVAAAAPTLAAGSGTSKSCLALNHVDEQRIVDDRTIYFREGRRWYRNDLQGSCIGLSPARAFSSRTPGTQLCRGDIISVFDPSTRFEFGSCAVGDYTPAAGPPSAAAR